MKTLKDVDITMVTKLQESASRLISVQNEVLGMPQEQQQWFFGKEGHSDAFELAWFVNIYLQPAEIQALHDRDRRIAELEAENKRLRQYVAPNAEDGRSE